MLTKRQIIIITPPTRLAFPNLKNMWEAREVLLRFGARDVTLRYRQTALGVIWVVIQPLASAGIFTIVFGGVANLKTGAIPYFLFSLSGMLAWNLFSGVVSRSTPSLVSNASLVSKVFFPRILVPLSTAYSVLLDFGVAFVLFIALLFVYGVNPGWVILLLPVWVLLIVIFACGFGLIFSALMVRYRDVQYVVPFMLQLGLYASPIAYATSNVPAKYKALYDSNPLTWILQEFRWSTLGQATPPAWQIVASVAVALAVLLVGTLIFEKAERGFADVI